MVDPEVRGGVGGHEGGDRTARGAQQRQHIAEVVLARLVVVAQPLQRARQRRGVEGEGAGADLAQGEDLGRHLVGMLGLDDSVDVAVVAADHAAVGAGVVELNRHHRRRRARRAVGGKQLIEHRPGDQGVVAGHDDHGVGVGDQLRGGADRPAGAVGLRLDHGLNAIRKQALQIAVGRDDHGDPVGAGLAGGGNRPGDHRPPAYGVHHLRERGAHPGPLARRHDQDGGAGHGAIVERERPDLRGPSRSRWSSFCSAPE